MTGHVPQGVDAPVRPPRRPTPPNTALPADGPTALGPGRSRRPEVSPAPLGLLRRPAPAQRPGGSSRTALPSAVRPTDGTDGGQQPNPKPDSTWKNWPYARTVGMPSRRTLPPFLGIVTCLTGSGSNVPLRSEERISSRNGTTSSSVMA